MSSFYRPVIFFLYVLFHSCIVNDSKIKQDYLLHEKDLIPEGPAFDSATQTIYVSSIWGR